jgi:hypothetical protein
LVLLLLLCGARDLGYQIAQALHQVSDSAVDWVAAAAAASAPTVWRLVLVRRARAADELLQQQQRTLIHDCCQLRRQTLQQQLSQAAVRCVACVGSCWDTWCCMLPWRAIHRLHHESKSSMVWVCALWS